MIGYDIDVNTAGDVIIISSPYSDVISDAEGFVKCYKWNDTEWVQLGQTIKGNYISDWV